MSSRGVSEKTENLIIFLIGKIYSFTPLLCENGRFQSECNDLVVSENFGEKITPEYINLYAYFPMFLS